MKDEESAGHRESEFSLSADVPRDYDHSGAMRCLSLIQQTALMNSDRESVDLLIGLNPSEKDLPYRLVFGLVFYDKSVVTQIRYIFVIKVWVSCI